MKQLMSGALAVFFGLVFSHVPANSGGYGRGVARHSGDFEKMKELVGDWQGTADIGKGLQTF